VCASDLSMTNGGVDFALLQGKLSGELEYFHRRTEGILRQVAIPSQVGALAGPIRNIAVVDNSGFELGLNYTNQIGTDFSYEIGGNFSKIKNEEIGRAHV